MEVKKTDKDNIVDTEQKDKEIETPTDEEIAVTANKIIKEKDEVIKKQNKEIARLKLLQQVPDEEEQLMTKEECLKVIGSDNSTNYDYAVAVVNLHNIAADNEEPSPLGKDGDKVAQFFADVIERCDGDKTKFVSVYQSMIADDPKEIQLSQSARNKLRR